MKQEEAEKRKDKSRAGRSATLLQSKVRHLTNRSTWPLPVCGS